ncbi:hypothetical protein NJ7G_0373 [Natrinema sp. J7-2]|nr:hypothetical protein NJ7G_0373 [Natrinema sp. J7-2]
MDTAARHGWSRGESTVGFERPQLPFGFQSFDVVAAGSTETPGCAAQTDGDLPRTVRRPVTNNTASVGDK